MNTRWMVSIMLVLMLLSGCTTLWRGGSYVETRQGASSSLVDFLYPSGKALPRPDDQLPSLSLPLRVGIAFVPSNRFDDISEVEKQELLERVAEAFRDRPFVASIEPIPNTYLKTVKGIRGMQQVAGMFGVDVMALVSYDQLSLSGERNIAVLYWTIVGALVFKGNTNEVQTMIDTAVFDAHSAKLLFRAPGVFNDKGNSTLVHSERDLRTLRLQGFDMATDDMISNLDHELETFRDAVRSGQRAQVDWKPGSGGGSIDFAVLLFVAIVWLAKSNFASLSPLHS